MLQGPELEREEFELHSWSRKAPEKEAKATFCKVSGVITAIRWLQIES